MRVGEIGIDFDHLLLRVTDTDTDGAMAIVVSGGMVGSNKAADVQRDIEFDPLTSKDYEAITLLNYVLGGGGFSSRLMKLIRSEHGLTYGVRSRFSSGERAGPFMITTFTRVEKVRGLIDLTFQVVDRLVAEGVGETELADAKGYYLGSYPLSLETVEGEGGRLLYAARYGLGDDYISAYPKRQWNGLQPPRM